MDKISAHKDTLSNLPHSTLSPFDHPTNQALNDT